MEYKYAKDIAVKLCYALQPYCELINIAGSIRRKKPEVKDIEIICVCKTELQKDMFGYPTGRLPVAGFTNTVRSFGKVIKGETSGKYMQIKLPEEIKLDLFMPPEYDYYRQLAIRTGPAEYSNKVLAAGWNKIGWCGSNLGLRKIRDCQKHTKPDGGVFWICCDHSAEKPPVWKSEKEFYQWLKIPYIEPVNRTYAHQS